jgi:hypothetical protein
MKHALMMNMCPACGKGLFSDQDMNLIQLLQNDLGGQPFSRNFTEEMIYDISLFIFNQLRHGIGKSVIEDEVERRLEDRKSDDSPTNQSDDGEPSMDDIRREVEAEFKEEIEEITEQEDVFSKVDRLKRLAQKRAENAPQKRPQITESKRTGTRVSRRS